MSKLLQRMMHHGSVHPEALSVLQVVLDGVADGGALGLLFLESQAYHYDRTNFVCVPLLGCHLLQLSEIYPLRYLHIW